jgi:hypothetical protein
MKIPETDITDFKNRTVRDTVFFFFFFSPSSSAFTFSSYSYSVAPHCSG